ncbi:MAG: SIR2 family protein, partial [Anaerolineae bacterium]|nr:SIR2 family protein [Anaerolineae bacterium]
ASALSMVVGAGATIDAGGPSWPALVRRLLDIALTKGHEITEMVRTPDSTEDHLTMERRVIDVKRLDSQQEMIARHVLGLIDAGKADTEDLMLGAQLCYDLFGQHLFMHLTGILYENGRQPGAIHQAIADLADFQLVPDRGPGLFPGLDSIITYNFEDLLGEALDARGFGRVAWAMRGDEMAGDPNEIARKAGQNSDYLHIYHLHGYTPRRLFLITQVRFIFSTAQYLREYQDRRSGIIDNVFYQYLANPVHYALYVGCSFDDDAMNDLLRHAASQLPGRQHYALLHWPGPKPYLQSGMDELEKAAERYVDIGVRPIWFDDFDEIPGMIRLLK